MFQFEMGPEGFKQNFDITLIDIFKLKLIGITMSLNQIKIPIEIKALNVLKKCTARYDCN